MGRAMRGAGSRTIVAVKAGAKNGAKDARRSRALCTRCVLAEKAGARHETGAAADSDCLARLMSGLRLCTLRSGGRAQLLSHHRLRHTRELQRCTRADLNATRHIPSTFRSRPPPGVDTTSDCKAVLEPQYSTTYCLRNQVLEIETLDFALIS